MIEPNIVDFLFNDDVNLNGVVYILDDNAVDDEANHHAQPVRNENYVEVTVPQYTVSEFKNHFRMSRMAVEQLIGLVSNHLPDKHSVPIEKQVLFSIWLLAKQESFLAVGDRFNLSSGSGHYIFMNFISAVGHLTHQFIEWPNARTCNEIASRIETKYGKYV
uniref:Transposase Helix-turn-helix domain-containing protein n=1 Tax=Photinus pyralis TaxID=7054 RepID=A0A1Y1MV81_PHOPY